jgi:hypothetical protein
MVAIATITCLHRIFKKDQNLNTNTDIQGDITAINLR